VLICFRGRLKRKGPTDKAYERKQCSEDVGSDAKGRAFLAGITRTRQHGGPVASSDNCMKSTRNADSAGGFVQPVGDSVSMTWSKSLEEGSRNVRIESHTNGQGCRLVYYAINRAVGDAANKRLSVGVQQTHPVVGHHGIDRNHGYIPLRPTTQEQPFHHPPIFQGSGDPTTACVWERGRTSWDAVIQSHRTEQLVTYRPDVDKVNRSGHTTWAADRSIIHPNDDLFSDLAYPSCRSVPFDDAISPPTFPSSTDCRVDSELMMSDWLNTNSNSVGFVSDDRCQRNDCYHQPVAYDNRKQMY